MTTWIKVDKTQNGYTVDPDATPATADLENNHETTINVSTYTDPVEITPAQGKDGMKKATVILNNIPSGGSAPYCYALPTLDEDKFIVCDGTVEFISLVCNGYSCEAPFIPNSESYNARIQNLGGRTILSEWHNSTPFDYAHVIPKEGDNPNIQGWYEYDSYNDSYVYSTDTIVDPTKTYFMDVWVQESNCSSLVFSNNDTQYIIAGGQDENMTQFTAGPVPVNS